MSIYNFSWNEGKTKSEVAKEKELERSKARKLRDEAVENMEYLLEITGGSFCRRQKAIEILGDEIYESILHGFECNDWIEAVEFTKSRYPHVIKRAAKKAYEQAEEKKSRPASFSDEELFQKTSSARKFLIKNGKVLNYSSLHKSIVLEDGTKSPTLSTWKNRWGFYASHVNHALDLYDSGMSIADILARNIIAETEAIDTKAAKAAKAQASFRKLGIVAVEAIPYSSKAVGKFDGQTVLREVTDFAKELGRVPILEELNNRCKDEPSFPSAPTIRKYLPKNWREQIAREVAK